FFAEKFPKRFFQIGVAEQNLVGVAAGLAVSGKIPFMATYAVFSPGRTLEQIRTAIAYNDANVKIAGHHSGLLTGFDGATHQALEDIAVMRTIPNMKVVVPADAIEAKKATIFSAQINGPVYLRFAREKTPVFTVEETPFTIGKAEIFWQSLAGGKKPEVLIVGCGPILYNALLAAKELEKEKIGTIVLNNHTIKPLDENKIIELAKKCGAVVSVEEHSVLGGLGGAIAEVLVKNYPAPMEFVGTKDTFGESAAPKDLFKKYGLEPKDIITAVKKVIKRKK
ncbi:transketolase, partial [Candidatus Wolfebacteria bacterium CG_4_10_14_0_2_um_filter_39_18]